MTWRLVTPPETAHVSRKWDRQYERHARDPHYARHLAIGEKLRELGPAPTRAAIEAIIGNRSWTRIECSGDHGESARLVEVGCDESTKLCSKCIAEISEMLRGDHRAMEEGDL